jgi:large subunit ribosomal protein L30
MQEDSILPEEKNDERKAERRPRAPRKPKAEAGATVKAPKLSKVLVSETAELKKEAAKAPSGEKLKPAHAEANQKLFAVVMVRGVVGTDRKLKDTLRMLRLDRINHCVVVPKNQNYDGMLHKARNFVTWGEIDKETLEKMVAKRGRLAGDKRVKDMSYAKELAQLILSGKKVKETGIKPVFRLSPPSKGYKSTKVLFPRGSLGYRGEKINELIKRMI